MEKSSQLYCIEIIYDYCMIATNDQALNPNNDFDRLQFSTSAKVEMFGMRDGNIWGICQNFAAFEWTAASRTSWINERSDMCEYTSRGLVRGV